MLTDVRGSLKDERAWFFAGVIRLPHLVNVFSRVLGHSGDKHSILSLNLAIRLVFSLSNNLVGIAYA